jgi:hypothetical protein
LVRQFAEELVRRIVAGHFPDALRLAMVAQHHRQHLDPLAEIRLEAFLHVVLSHLDLVADQFLQRDRRPDGVAHVQFDRRLVAFGDRFQPGLDVRPPSGLISVGVGRSSHLQIDVPLLDRLVPAAQFLLQQAAVDFAVQDFLAVPSDTFFGQLRDRDLSAVDHAAKPGFRA